MQRQSVVSSEISSVGLSILEIEFKSGAVYQYFIVPKRIFDGLIGAESKGSFFGQNIREKFAYSRVS